MSYRYQATETFWRNFHALTPSQKQSSRKAWAIFKENPFDARLRTHKIHALSARYKRTIHSAAIEGDLRVVFYVETDTVWTVDIGSHALYR